MKRLFIFFVIPITVMGISFFGFYTYWNNADPEKSCSSCHEITPSVSSLQHSAHREIRCFDCHGNALSNGFHSLKEKANMVLTHITDERWNEDISLNESQVLEVTERCTICHQSEYTKWKSGRHSTSYSDIFLNTLHNSMERVYWDCFRCHGMFFEGNIYDLISPVSKEGPWELIDKEKADQPAIPCLACHQAHTENELYPSLKNVQGSLPLKGRNPVFGLYIRSDRIFLRGDHLPEPNMYLENEQILYSDDPSQSLCIQCHAPGAFHQVGTNDDRTPVGVHEGLSCNVCHEPHSNNADNSCITCHPAISNCGLDVETMNTSYSNPGSQHNIHFVSCDDCHEK